MSNIKSYKIKDGQADIPAGDTVKVCVRAFDNSVSTITLPVTQDILAFIAGTKEGSYYCVNLRYIEKYLPFCKSYYLPD